MLTAAKNQFKVSMMSVKYNIMREMVNPVSFITNILFMMLNNATFLIQWVILFSIQKNIGGYGFKEVMEIWAFSAGSYGIWHIFFKASGELPNMILTGKLDNYMVQPKNILLSALTSSTSISAIGDLLYGIILFSIINFNLYKILLFIVLIILGGIIITSFVTTLSSLTFFMGNSAILTEQATSIIILTSTYPINIYKRGIQLLLFTLIPTGIIIHLPVSVVSSFSLINFMNILLFTIAITGLAFTVFYSGLKKYSSSNLMNART